MGEVAGHEQVGRRGLAGLCIADDEAALVELDAVSLWVDEREVDGLAGTRVAYRALAGDPDWRRLVDSLEASEPSELGSRDERLAYWINAYNILAIDLVVKNYPVDSIRDIGSLFSAVWDREAGTIHGEPHTLGEIEHEILRPLGDPRIHAAIVCASTSCPSLPREPYTREKLDAQLDDAVRVFLASAEKGLRIDREEKRVVLSRIFDWFDEDFDASGGVLAFVARHAPQDSGDWLRRNAEHVDVSHFDYDWTLNDSAATPAR